MWAHIAGRVLQSALIVFLVVTLIFVLLHFAPGDPCLRLQQGRTIPPQVVEECRRRLELDRPIAVRYTTYLKGVVRGDFGRSLRGGGQPARDILVEAIPNTVILGIAALTVDFLLGLFVGTVQGVRSGTRLDHALTVLAVAFFSMPVFWFGLLLVQLFAHQLTWFPAGGSETVFVYDALSPLGKALDKLKHLVLPAVTLGLVSAAVTARYHRSATLESVRANFVRTARAKGLPAKRIVWRHILPNSLLPAITLFGLSLPALLSGVVLVEQVFTWKGLGWTTVEAIEGRDYNVVAGAAILASVMVVIGNAVADVLYRVVDPRTRSHP